MSSEGYSNLSLAILWGVFFLGFSVRMAVILTMPLISGDLRITHTQEGMLLSVMSISYGMIQFPSGILSDVLENKRLLTLVILFLVLAITSTSLSQSFNSLILSLFLLGLFVGFSLPISFSIISKRFKRKTGSVMGLYNTAPPIAQFFGSYVSGFLAVEYSWNHAFYLWVVIGLIFSILIWRVIKSSGMDSEVSRIDMRSIKSFFSDKNIHFFLFPFVAHSICAFSALNMNTLYMVEILEIDIALTASIFGVARLTGFTGSLLGGYLADRFSKTRLLLSSLVVTALSIYAFVTLPFNPWFVLILSLQAISINFFFPVIYSLILDISSTSTVGKAQGLYNSIAFSIGGMAPYVMGVITDLSSFKQAFMFPLIMASTGILWMLILDVVGCLGAD